MSSANVTQPYPAINCEKCQKIPTWYWFVLITLGVVAVLLQKAVGHMGRCTHTITSESLLLCWIEALSILLCTFLYCTCIRPTLLLSVKMHLQRMTMYIVMLCRILVLFYFQSSISNLFRGNLAQDSPVLRSYHLKTIFLWMAEEVRYMFISMVSKRFNTTWVRIMRSWWSTDTSQSWYVTL